MSKEATYRPLSDDGALFKCVECGEQSRAGEMWFVALPNGHKGVYHKGCVDEDWLQRATFVKEPM